MAREEHIKFFLDSKSTDVGLDLLSITHPNFTQEYHLVRNHTEGVLVTLEDNTTQFFQYCPLSVTPLSVSDDLDQNMKIQFGDLGEVLPKEIDAVSSAGGFDVKPTLVFRLYKSTDLTQPVLGPVKLEIDSVTHRKEGASIDAQAPNLNLGQTGELYKIDRFTSLRGFV